MVRDSCSDIAASADEFDVIVTEVVSVGVEELLTTFSQRPPKCALIVWTPGAESAKAMFQAAGIRGVAFVRKESRPDGLVGAVRASLGDLPGIARG